MKWIVYYIIINWIIKSQNERIKKNYLSFWIEIIRYHAKAHAGPQADACHALPPLGVKMTRMNEGWVPAGGDDFLNANNSPHGPKREAIYCILQNSRVRSVKAIHFYYGSVI